MTSTAISVLLRPAWPPIAAWPTALGAMFFYTSDVLLFQKHFLERKPVVKVLAIITYHIGQFAITYGFLWFLYS